MYRFRTFCCILLFLCLILSAYPKADRGKAETDWDIAFRTGNGTLEEISLLDYMIPEDYSGFTIGYLPGEENPILAVGDPVRTDEDGVVYYALSEEEAERIFNLPREILYTDGGIWKFVGEGTAHPSAVALLPDGSVFRYGPMIADDEGRYEEKVFIQRDHELVVTPEAGSGEKAAADYGIPRSVRQIRLPIERAEFSEDGRYASFQHNILTGGFELPWLLDTRTGKIIPLLNPEGIDQRYPTESSPDSRFCGILNGLFSGDSFYMILQGNLPEWGGEPCKMLMRYDLKTGAAEECCRLDAKAAYLYKTGRDRIMILTYDNRAFVIPAGGTDYTAEEIAWPELTSYSSPEVYSELSGSPVLLQQFWNIYAISILRNQPESDNTWYLLPNNPIAESFVSMSPEELQAFATDYAARTTTNPYERFDGPYCVISEFLPVSGTPYALLSYTGRVAEKESWTTFWQQDYRTMILNTETMEMKPFRRNAGTADSADLSDSDTCLLVRNTKLYRLNPDAPPEPETSRQTLSDEEARMRQESWENWVRTNVTEALYISGTDYSYGYEVTDSGELICNNRKYQTTGFLVSNDIDVLADSFRITVRMTMNAENAEPEYLVPYALTEERWKALADSGLKAKWKKVQTFYKKITPEKLGSLKNAEELIAMIPSVREQTMYVLRDDLKDHQKRTLEEAFSDLGYTPEDYVQDLQVLDPEYLKQNAVFPITYTFRADRPVRWTQGPAGALLTLTDRLGSLVYRQYLTADPKPASADSLPLAGRYELGGIPYRVTLDSAEETADQMTLVFTAVPEDEYGMIQ